MPNDIFLFKKVIAPTSDDNQRNSEATMIQLNNHSLLVVYNHFQTLSDHDTTARLYAITSNDDGLTWTSPKLFINDSGGINIMSPSLLRLNNGDILLGYARKNSLTDCEYVTRISHNDGDTWSGPVVVTQQKKYHAMNNHRLIQLKSGRIILPASYTDDDIKNYPKTYFKGIVLYSDDGGYQWHQSPSIIDTPNDNLNVFNAGAQEPDIVELNNGQLYMIIRTNQGHLYYSRSNDEGLTWSRAKSTGLQPPLAPASISLIPDSGDLIVIFNHAPKYRCPLSLAISHDQGEHWIIIADIEHESNHSYAYTSLYWHKMLNDTEALLTYYDYDANSDRVALRFTRLPKSWIHEHDLKYKQQPSSALKPL